MKIENWFLLLAVILLIVTGCHIDDIKAKIENKEVPDLYEIIPTDSLFFAPIDLPCRYGKQFIYLKRFNHIEDYVIGTIAPKNGEYKILIMQKLSDEKALMIIQDRGEFQEYFNDDLMSKTLYDDFWNMYDKQMIKFDPNLQDTRFSIYPNSMGYNIIEGGILSNGKGNWKKVIFSKKRVKIVDRCQSEIDWKKRKIVDKNAIKWKEKKKRR